MGSRVSTQEYMGAHQYISNFLTGSALGAKLIVTEGFHHNRFIIQNIWLRNRNGVFCHTRGINPEDLRLGSLYLNPLDPDDGLESKRFEYQEDLEQEEYEEHVSKWIRREQKDERGCSLDFELSKDTSLALKFSDLMKAEGNANSTVTATLEGKSGRRLKIKKPEKFLRDEVMAQEGVQEWIRTQASISFKGHFGMHKFKAPEIWMVTGIQLITGGDVHVGSSRSVTGPSAHLQDLHPSERRPAMAITARLTMPTGMMMRE